MVLERVLDLPFRLRLAVLAGYLLTFFYIEHALADMGAQFGILLLILLPARYFSLGFFTIVIGGTIPMILNYYVADNHVFLIYYFAIAFALAYAYTDDDEFRTAIYTYTKFLVGFLFLFAVIQKAKSPDYLSGEFFTLTLMLDERFFGLSAALIGHEEAIANLQARFDFIDAYHSNDPANATPGPSRPLILNQDLVDLALVLTWANFGYQAALCLLLFARMRALVWLKNIVSASFIVGTYLVAPVYAFGAMLCVMFYVLAEVELPRFRNVYLVLLALMTVYHFVFVGLLRAYGVPA